jgi:outer membrane protein W
MAAGLAVSAVAADSGSLFNAKELSLSLRSGYDVNAFGATKVADAFAKPYNFNLEAGAAYFLTKNLGAEVIVPFYQTKGVSLDNVQAGLVLRVPVFTHFAPYVGASADYAWNATDKFTYIAKAGLEFRFNRGWGLFTEADYQNKDFNWSKGNVSVNGGVRLTF